jgi:hypothetical protein
MERLESIRSVAGRGKTVILRPTFLMDDSLYPADHDSSTTKDWAVIVIDTADAVFPDPRTADGRDMARIAKARGDMKRAVKTYYWFDRFDDADAKFVELSKDTCGNEQKGYKGDIISQLKIK